MHKGKLNILFFLGVICTISLSTFSCSILQKSEQKEKPLTEKEMMKKLHKEEQRQQKIARKANEKAKKEFWKKQTPEVKRRIKETYKRDKKLRKQSLKRRRN